MGRMPAAQRREQLLSTALELFASKGYARTTTSQLAKAAGVTEPIIYRHFSSKRELFIALIVRSGRDTLAAWKKHLRTASTPAERIALLLEDNPMVHDAGREAYRVILQTITEVDDAELHEALNLHIQALHEFLAREVENAQEAGAVPSRFAADLIGWLLIEIGLGYGVLHAMRIPGHGIGTSGVHVKDVLAELLIGAPLPPSASKPASGAKPSKKAPSKTASAKKAASKKKPPPAKRSR